MSDMSMHDDFTFVPLKIFTSNFLRKLPVEKRRKFYFLCVHFNQEASVVTAIGV